MQPYLSWLAVKFPRTSNTDLFPASGIKAEHVRSNWSLCVSPTDPLDWSCMHVQKWLLWTEHLYRLPQVSTMFQELTGRDLCSMAEADFRQRSLQFGDVLYAHLDIWRSGERMKGRREMEMHELYCNDANCLLICC